MSNEFWTYDTEWSSVEGVALLFNTLEEAEKHSLKRYLDLNMDEEDWRQLTSFYKFKVYKDE